MESGILSIARRASRSWRRSPVRLVILVIAVLFGGSAHAQYVQAPPWQNKSTARAGATLDLDFVHDSYFVNGTTYTGIANFAGCQTTCPVTGVTFSRSGTTTVTPTNTAPFYLDGTQGQAFVSRASSATYFDNTGTLQTASTNVARSATYSYNGSAWIANSGALTEAAATNIITNNTMVGAVAGTPGTPPTNWRIYSGQGISSTVVGTGTENGINYIDIAFAGTATALVNLTVQFVPTNTTQAASIGQVWTLSGFVKLQSGSWGTYNQSPRWAVNYFDSLGTNLGQALMNPLIFDGAGEMESLSYD